jgi:acetyl/propionyl-CoA carboxylase alpha subunit/acetyl-CoA carboxylase carboxyltransferase component
MSNDIRRVAIINRGEPAMRFICAVREFNRERGTEIRTIVFYSTPDRRARFVHEADESVFLGEATFLDPRDRQRKASYLNYSRIEEALVACNADAAWVGWGFASERPEFVDLCTRLGIIFIGPDSASMRRLGDKISAKKLAEEIGIPTIPWGNGPAESIAAARSQAGKLGYPVVIKASAGEGGRGIRVVGSEDEIAAAFESARSEAVRAFGNPALYVERWMEGAHHVEVQILADCRGTTWAVGVRDCTIQRRHQKVVEEAPATVLRAESEREMKAAAVRLCKAAGYRNAGTVEFLYDPKSGGCALMEVNARLQVEHPVTELTTGLDLVKLQLHIARGGRLQGRPPKVRGHAIEVRLNAEDAENGFAAAPGAVELFRIPTHAGLRLDTGVSEGDVIPAEFDSMFAKLIGFGATREEALASLIRALEDSALVILGGTTNRAFLFQTLQRPEVREGSVDVGWLDRQTVTGEHISTRFADVALFQAAIDVYDNEFEEEREQFFATASRMRPVIRTEAGRTIELRHRGQHYKLRVYRHSIQHYRIEVDGAGIDVEVNRTDRYEQWLAFSGRRYRVVASVSGLNHIVEVGGATHHISRGDMGIIRANAPSVVVLVDVKAGQRVSAGERIALLEAMKMEMPVAAPFSGTVREVLVLANAQVGTGSSLIHLDPAEQEDSGESSPRVVFCSSRVWEQEPEARLHSILTQLRNLMLGSDIHPIDSKRLIEDYGALCSQLAPDHPDLCRMEDQILEVFVDVSSLFRRQQTPEDPEDQERLSTGEYLLSYLRTMETRGAGLPASFLDKLQLALRHYGSDSLEPTAALRGRLLWIFKSHQHMEQQAEAIAALLDRRLKRAKDLLPHADSAFFRLLGQLLAVFEGRFPILCDLARDVRYRYFEEPLFERARSATHAETEAHLAYLALHPEAADRAERIQALIDCPDPLRNLLMDQFENASSSVRELILEVLTRRYYRLRNLEGFRTVEVHGRRFAMAEYSDDSKQVYLVSTHAEGAELRAAAESLRTIINEFPPDREVAVDLYAWQPDLAKGADAAEIALGNMIREIGFPRPVQRVVVVIAGPREGTGAGSIQHYTFRLSEDGYREEALYRGLHPMMSERLQLWRLQHFHIERLPSAEDVFLFRGVAHENPKDERLFAIAEVRDLTPVMDSAGHIVQLPHLERMLAEALAAIRQVQLQRAPEGRLYWNRVFLYVWPPIFWKPEEFQGMSRRLARQTEGLGLEKVVLQARMPDSETGHLRDVVVSISNPGGRGIALRFAPPSEQPLRPLTEYVQKVVRMRQRGLPYPYEVIRALTPPPDSSPVEFPPGEFTEYDLDASGVLVPTHRPFGENRANIVVGVIRNTTPKHPEGMMRVLLLGDPSRELGSIAEPECRRILAAIDLAEKMRVSLEWFTLSAGAKISMESGTENMDWIARVLRRLITFTQAGGEVNIIVAGINVGAQPYWNAEATMLMHTRGVLIMMPESAMVLTGKTALDYSGSVSAEDNQGIGGYEAIMGPNGQAQYWARDLGEACRILMRYYEYTYVMPGERFPRSSTTTDPRDRDVRQFPHRVGGGDGFATVGEIFSDETNPGRKKAFDIRRVMLSVTDQDHQPLERWSGMRDAEVAVVWDAHIGGYPVCLLGFESRSVPRVGFVATDGPDQWTSGTLFPVASKKVARAINAASNNRPLVILANLSGFDGSPESMRRRQLEFGAEIGRAIVNFKGPIVFCVISRYHGGAFVVFSRALNENMEVVALEGSYASVIGGAPAAAVVFAREVDVRTRKDPRIQEFEHQLASADDTGKRRLRAQLNELRKVVRSEKLGEVADEFDRIHSVHRALRVGSLDRIIPAFELRPYLIDAIERGMRQELERIAQI